jgi:L-lysine 2,3-aminomutase
MRTLAKRLRKEQKKVKIAVKERDAALHQADIQRKIRLKEELKRKTQGQLLAYLIREHSGGEIEVDVAKMQQENPEGTVATKPQDGKMRIKVL